MRKRKGHTKGKGGGKEHAITHAYSKFSPGVINKQYIYTVGVDIHLSITCCNGHTASLTTVMQLHGHSNSLSSMTENIIMLCNVQWLHALQPI